MNLLDLVIALKGTSTEESREVDQKVAKVLLQDEELKQAAGGVGIDGTHNLLGLGGTHI